MAETDSSTVEWETFHQQVRRRVTPAAWQTWIEPLHSSVESGSLRLVAPTDFHYRWVGDRYLPALEEAAMDTLGLAVELSVVPTIVDPNAEPPAVAHARQVSLPIDTDHFMCYDVTSYGLQKGLIVGLEDQFDNRDYEIDKTELLCNPVEKSYNGTITPITVEHGHLACYKIKQIEKGRNEVDAQANLSNQFGEEAVDVKHTHELCVPSIKTIGAQ